jgi:hypothetical protein
MNSCPPKLTLNGKAGGLSFLSHLLNLIEPCLRYKVLPMRPVRTKEKWCRHEESNPGPTDYKAVNFLYLSVRKCLQEAVLAPWIELEVYLAVSIHTRTSTIQIHLLVHFHFDKPFPVALGRD